MRTYMARLGSFEFGIDTAAFKELQRNSAYRWQAKNRIGRRPAMQNTGREADSISLSGVIYPHWRGGLGQMSTLRAMADTGMPVPLVYAFDTTGQYCGLWCIAAIDETRTVFFEGGGPRRIEFRVSLKEYGEDADALAVAIDVANVASKVDADGAVSEAAALEGEVGALSTAEQASGILSKVVSTATSVTSTISGGIDTVLNSDAMRLAKNSVTSVAQLKSTAANLQNSVKGLKNANSPSAVLSALGSMTNAASSATDVMTSTTARLTGQQDLYSGKSKDSLYTKQTKSAVSTINKFAQASLSLKNIGTKLTGII